MNRDQRETPLTTPAATSPDSPHRTSESARIEAFSDGVLAIAVTLLVLDLRSDFDPGNFAHELGAQWPSYLAYLAAFLNVSAIWINHHDLFTRVRGVDAGVLSLNLLLLLVASLFPWPAAVISSALLDGTNHDQIVAGLLYAGIGFMVPLTFIAIHTYLIHAPHLFTDSSHVAYSRISRRRALLSILVYPITAVLVFVSIDVALGLFITVPLFFIAAVFLQQRAEKNERSHPADADVTAPLL